MTRAEKISIIGCGLIGRSWAMLFASAGYQVAIYDICFAKIEEALNEIQFQFTSLKEKGLLRGSLSVKEQFGCIRGSTNLNETVSNAVLIQECVPENLVLKKKVWQEIDDIAGPNSIYASSTSSFVPSLFTGHLKNKKNALVSHPVNPPYYIPLVEMVPAPWTDPAIITKTTEIMTEIGQTPVKFKKETTGFAFNRFQFVIFVQALNLIKEGVLDVKDIDNVISDGLGFRFAFLGPLESIHLNAGGFANYFEKYVGAYKAIEETIKPLDLYGLEKSLVDEIDKQLTPLEEIHERRHWRDLCLIKLSQLKKETKQ